jgi:hypothetical protein
MGRTLELRKGGLTMHALILALAIGNSPTGYIQVQVDSRQEIAIFIKDKDGREIHMRPNTVYRISPGPLRVYVRYTDWDTTVTEHYDTEILPGFVTGLTLQVPAIQQIVSI